MNYTRPLSVAHGADVRCFDSAKTADLLLSSFEFRQEAQVLRPVVIDSPVRHARTLFRESAFKGAC